MHEAPRKLRLLYEMPFVADERQNSSDPREYARARREHRIVCCGHDHARRAEAEAFINARFFKSHGAHISSFMPTLLLLTDPDGDLVGVAGFRSAAHEPLFLERYLAVPIEKALTRRTGAMVLREEIIEAGNFAALDSRRAAILMSFMPAFFLQEAARWLVFTATTSIRGIVAALGGRCVEIGAADGACVIGGADEWGRYYSNDPRVMAGFLPSARRIPKLWRSSHGD
jgi:uncharacterized membrane protein